MTRSTNPLGFALAACVLVTLACGSGGKQTSTTAAAAPPPSERPLAALAGQRVAVLPAQRFRRDDRPGWGDRMSTTREMLAALDDEIAFALGERGLKSTWVFASVVAGTARRNPTYAPDPYALAINQLEMAERRPDEPIAEPLASQLRVLAGLTDARYLLLPLVLRFEPRGAAGRAVIEVALVDARLAQLSYRSSVAGDDAASFSPAMTASAAARLADLVATR